MHKLMCTFMTPMKKKIPDRNLDTSCPAGIPCNNSHLEDSRQRNFDKNFAFKDWLVSFFNHFSDFQRLLERVKSIFSACRRQSKQNIKMCSFHLLAVLTASYH